jgi:hypothetical protein
MQTPKPPRWSDEKAVAEFVAEVIDDREAEAEYQAEMDGAYYQDHIPAFTVAELAGSADNRAAEEKYVVTVALDGNLEPLIEFLCNPYNVSFRLSLAPSTRHLIVEFLTGARSLHTGKPKGQPGRPKMSEEKRRASNPIHDAAGEFPLIKKILKQYYPTQSAGHINDRAEAIAQKRANIATSVKNYRRRSGKHPHKLR